MSDESIPTVEEVFGKPETTLSQLKEHCEQIRRMISSEYPPALLSFCWSLLLSQLIEKAREDESEFLPPVSTDQSAIMFAMEYIHATFAGTMESNLERKQVDEKVALEIIELADVIRAEAMKYSMSVSLGDMSLAAQELDNAIRMNWILVRGKRFEVLEEEFFNFVLAPHEQKLRELYGVGGQDIAEAIQNISNLSRRGLGEAFEGLRKCQEKHEALASEAGLEIAEYLERLTQEDPAQLAELDRLMDKAFWGGTFCVDEVSGLPSILLDDLSMTRGEDSSFFDGGEFSGTPFRTLPARIKPLLKIQDKHYTSDPHFIRDSTYRCIQRALISKDPSYKELWNQKQKILSETAFAALFSDRLHNAQIFHDVYYPLPDGNWAECDCVIEIDDILVVIEAKAGSETLLNVSENLEAHKAAIRRLVIKAHAQCKRFLDYCASDKEVALFKKEDGKFLEAAKLRLSSYRKVFPIGLTVETFSPFSAMSKTMPEIRPILGEHHFVSLSVDDLFVLRHILPTLGNLLHYFDVRQQLSGIPQASLHDEIDHLGAYLSRNRVDWIAKHEIEKEGLSGIVFDGFDVDVVAPYFMYPDTPPPKQDFPELLEELLSLADTRRSPGWLRIDQFIRDLGTQGRSGFVRDFEQALARLQLRPMTWALLNSQEPVLCFVSRDDGNDYSRLAAEAAEVAALATQKTGLPLFEFAVNRHWTCTSLQSRFIKAPSILRTDFYSLSSRAAELRSKLAGRER